MQTGLKQRESLHGKYRVLSILLQLQFAVSSDSSPRKEAKRISIRASQTTAAASPRPSGSALHDQVPNWVRHAGQHQKHKRKHGSCSQLALSAPQMPKGTHRGSSQSLNESSSPNRLLALGRLGPNQFKPNTCISRAKQGA